MNKKKNEGVFPHLAKLDLVPVVLGNLRPRILLFQLDMLLGNLPRLLFLLLMCDRRTCFERKKYKNNINTDTSAVSEFDRSEWSILSSGKLRDAYGRACYGERYTHVYRTW